MHTLGEGQVQLSPSRLEVLSRSVEPVSSIPLMHNRGGDHTSCVKGSPRDVLMKKPPLALPAGTALAVYLEMILDLVRYYEWYSRIGTFLLPVYRVYSTVGVYRTSTSSPVPENASKNG